MASNVRRRKEVFFFSIVDNEFSVDQLIIVSALIAGN